MTDTPTKIVYTAQASITGGREGHGRTDDGLLDVSLTAAKELGGPGTGTNPEQLFAVGYGACFQSALTVVAKKEGVDASGSVVRTSVGFGPEGDSYALTVDIVAEIPGTDDATAQRLVEAAHQICPYSKATRGNVPVSVTGRGAAAA